MGFFEWDDSLAVGVERIDQQHRELFEAINRLLDAMKERRGKEEAGRCLSFLADYVERHFGEEEQLMARRAYPARDAHLAQHAAFRASFKDLAVDLVRDGPSSELAVRVQTQVGEWLRKHIRTIDVQLGRFLQQPALPAEAGRSAGAPGVRPV
jgi:hemerythrin